MISCNDLTMDHGSRILFKNVNLNLLSRNRYAIVGANGSGKSTFLKILMGEEHFTQGTIEIPKKAVKGILKQDHFRYEHDRVIDVVLDGKPELLTVLRDKEKLLQCEHFGEAECNLLAELEEKIAVYDGYAAESQAQIILQGLGIAENFHHGPLSALSGGYKLRVLLAQSLFKNPDILLLDEPTNHLDIFSIEWLENFLVSQYKGLLIFVSHDKQFINNTSNYILDIDYETITPYPGNYDAFIFKKEEVVRQLEHEIHNKQQKIDAMQAFADKFRATPSKAKQAMSRLKMIDKIEMPDVKKSSRIQPNFHISFTKPTGKLILSVEQLKHAYGERVLFDNVHFHLTRSQKLAIIGQNGVGKSTLLKILLEDIELQQGKFQWSESVKMGYFAQDFHDLLEPDLTLLQWLCQAVQGTSELNARKALGQMLFSGAEVDKFIKVLSGGECARLLFAKLILEQCNVLVLDEPTNHLDLEAIEGLCEGLRNYAGTVLLVSHNRYLISKIATQVLVMKPEGVELYPGTYREYCER